MGGCVSFPVNNGGDIGGAPPAHVISLTGDLLEFPSSTTVSEVLNQDTNNNSSILCNSDKLNFDEYISPLNPQYQLQAGQIYFILPKSKVHYKLSASDMAALAVKASLALQKSSAKNNNSSTRRKKKKARISPIIIDLKNDQEEEGCSRSVDNEKSYGVSRSGSVRKFQRVSSRRAKLAVRSYRLKLSTIYEGTVLLAH